MIATYHLISPAEFKEVPDEMEKLYVQLKQANLYPTGEQKPLTERDFRSSFIRRCKNNTLNEKLHHCRALRSTLKVSSPTTQWDLNLDQQLHTGQKYAPKKVFPLFHSPVMTCLALIKLILGITYSNSAMDIQFIQLSGDSSYIDGTYWGILRPCS